MWLGQDVRLAVESGATGGGFKVDTHSIMSQRVIIQWRLSSYYGWGVYGLNLALNWATDPAIEAIGAADIRLDQISIDAVRRQALMPFFRRSIDLLAGFERFANRAVTAHTPVLIALGNSFVSSTAAHNITLDGCPSIGVIFFEDAMDAAALQRAKRFALVITGSTWNEQLLRAYGVEPVRTVLQGVDPSHFHIAPKLGLMPDRFLIFSGGKAEIRKGQDLVLAAFKIFGSRHPEAVLVTAWHSPWPHLARTLDRTGKAAPVAFNKNGAVDVHAWAHANGVRSNQILDLGNVPNALMPSVLREMNVAVFPNRAEGGTNLVAMECMACGLPVILSRNTGHLDLIEDDNCYALDHQQPVAGAFAGVDGVSGWGESDVEELVARLEQVFSDHAEAARRGRLAARTLSKLSWAATAAGVKSLVLGRA
jgi:glycosyltransferase involved in cell wall biosynthesis